MTDAQKKLILSKMDFRRKKEMFEDMRKELNLVLSRESGQSEVRGGDWQEVG